ncbi:hypothetical protein [Endozoicomonas sp. ALC066]|uniref:hypothetical protein n=1 Tax=Endozoicomonas sp. ALC066 TaxID=3403078 RepID=UPI003BB6B06E
MEVKLQEHTCKVYRTENDPPIYTESAFYHKLKLALQAQGHGVVKKLMWKDGHLMGDDKLPYIRSRTPRKDPELMIFDPAWAVRDIAKDYRNQRVVHLRVQRKEK